MPYKHDYDKAMFRLVTILQRLYEGEEIRIKDLADELGVSTKTIQRDLNERLVRFPIERSGNRFFMSAGHRIEKCSDPENVIVLDILEQMSESVGPRFSMKAKSLLSKIKNEHESPLYARIELEDISHKFNEVSQLEQCIKARHEVAFDYEFDFGAYRLDVQPLKIISFEGFWYLLGMDARNGIVKKYYLNSISKVEDKEVVFKAPKDVEDRLDGALNVWFNPNVKPYPIRLRVYPEMAKYLNRRPLAPHQMTEALYDDGSCDVMIKITHNQEIIPVILNRMPHVVVLEPEELREEIREIIDVYSQRLDEMG